jgi:hypothetical protein
MKTSLTDPLRIAAVSPPDMAGRIGLTLCPGKKDPGRDRDWDLDIDLAVIREWGAEMVVTLVERHEFDLLDVAPLPEAVARHGMRWVHLPLNHPFPTWSGAARLAFGRASGPTIRVWRFASPTA